MDIPNAVNIAILGGCESTVTFLHTVPSSLYVY